MCGSVLSKRGIQDTANSIDKVVARKMKDRLKALVAVLLSAVLALGITMGTGFALADEENHEHEADEYEVTFSSSPRFPVLGEEAELTFEISHSGSHEEELVVMVVLAKAEEDDHHDEAEVDDHRDEAENTEVGPVTIMATETAPGVYAVKYTFEQEGKYLVTAQIGEEQTDFVVAVRSSPIAWPFLIGLVGISALLAGVVAVRKKGKKEW